MILILESNITQNQKGKIKNMLSDEGCITHEITDAGRDIIGVIGKTRMGIDEFKQMDGVADAVPIKTSYKLVSREFKSEDTKVKIGDVVVGADRIVIVAGPCAVESHEQAMTIAKEVKKYGAVLFRGGAYKPRSSPYSFQGLEEEGLKILADVREKTGLGVVTEITSVSQADLMIPVFGVSLLNLQLNGICINMRLKHLMAEHFLRATLMLSSVVKDQKQCQKYIV